MDPKSPKPDTPNSKKKKRKDPGLVLQHYLTHGRSPEETLFKINELLYSGKYQNTRRYDRAPVSMPVVYEVSGNACSGISYTLSQKGIFIKCASPPPVGSEVKVKLRLPEDGRSIELKGDVVQSADLEEAKKESSLSGMSVVFKEISQEDRRRLQRVVKSWIRNLRAGE